MALNPPPKTTGDPEQDDKVQVNEALQAAKVLIENIDELKQQKRVSVTKLAGDVARALTNLTKPPDAQPVIVDPQKVLVIVTPCASQTKTVDDDFQAKIQACEKVLEIVRSRIKELKTSKREAFRAVLTSRIAELRADMAKEISGNMAKNKQSEKEIKELEGELRKIGGAQSNGTLAKGSSKVAKRKARPNEPKVGVAA